MSDWVSIAFTGPVVRRGLKYAVIVGAVLIMINHGDALMAGHVERPQYIKMALTVVVPYCVSVLSSVGALLDARARNAERRADDPV